MFSRSSARFPDAIGCAVVLQENCAARARGTSPFKSRSSKRPRISAPRELPVKTNPVGAATASIWCARGSRSHANRANTKYSHSRVLLNSDRRQRLYAGLIGLRVRQRCWKSRAPLRAPARKECRVRSAEPSEIARRDLGSVRRCGPPKGPSDRPSLGRRATTTIIAVAGHNAVEKLPGSALATGRIYFVQVFL